MTYIEEEIQIFMATPVDKVKGIDNRGQGLIGKMFNAEFDIELLGVNLPEW